MWLRYSGHIMSVLEVIHSKTKNTKKERKVIMGRINYEDVDKYGNNQDTEFLKLENDGDCATVQLLTIFSLIITLAPNFIAFCTYLSS